MSQRDKEDTMQDLRVEKQMGFKFINFKLFSN